jgi:hypothetical protein
LQEHPLTKAILLLDFQDTSQGPAILCAESTEEAQAQHLPLFSAVFAELSFGLELTSNGDGYDLFEKGRHVGALEIFPLARSDGSSDGD